MKRVNEWFFGSKEIHPSDAVWFYGGLTSWVGLVAFVLMATN